MNYYSPIMMGEFKFITFNSPVCNLQCRLHFHQKYLTFYSSDITCHLPKRKGGSLYGNGKKYVEFSHSICNLIDMGHLHISSIES